MRLLFYTTPSANNRITKILNDGKEVQGALRDGEFSISAPVIRLQMNPQDYNYCYIPQFERYYFIRDIRVARNDLFYVSLEVDVLMSFKSEILALNALIGKQEEGGNPYADGQFKIEVRTDTTTFEFESPFSSGDYILITQRAGDN